MKKSNALFHIMYAIIVITIIFMVVRVAAEGNMVSPMEEMSKNMISFEDGWTLYNGKKADISSLGDNEGAEPERAFSIYNTIPENLPEGMCLCFRTKNIFYKVYIDGSLRYEPEVAENSAYNKTPGNRHVYIPLYTSDAGKTVQIKITTVYVNAKAKISDVCIGQSGGVVLSFLYGKMVAIVASLALLFIGFMLIFADIPLNVQEQKNHELAYLGIISISMAVWSILETAAFQLFIGDSRLIQSISVTSLMLLVCPIALYFDSAFGFGFEHIKGFICGLSFFEFLLCFVFHMTGIMDFHECLIITHIMFIFSTILIVVSIIKKGKNKDGEKARVVFRLFKFVGLMALVISAMLDIVRDYFFDTTDNAFCVRIGFVIFMLCFGVSSMEKTVNAVRLGARSEMISELAYKDGLTGVGNRTLFKERIAELEENKNFANEVVFVMFDVNDLKYINDKMGHKTGDQLIVRSADMIRDSFEKVGGSCFRIGGDEFIVIITGDIPVAQYNEGMKTLESMIAEHNANPDKPFRISIASGMATYNESSRDKTMSDIWHMADAFMYKNKKEMKIRMIEAHEYYTGKLTTTRE